MEERHEHPRQHNQRPRHDVAVGRLDQRTPVPKECVAEDQRTVFEIDGLTRRPQRGRRGPQRAKERHVVWRGGCAAREAP
jgi:hypothetical protein